MAPALRPGLLTSLVRPAARSTASFVGVGGFLGVGEREVLLNWRDLQIEASGEVVRANMTKGLLVPHGRALHAAKCGVSRATYRVRTEKAVHHAAADPAAR
jgi:hypothetical protein